MIPKPLAVAIVCLVTVVWAASFVAQFLVPGYQMDGWIHSIFMTVVGGALVASRKGKGGDDPDPPALEADGSPTPPPPPDTPRPGGAHRASLVVVPWRFAT